MENETVKNETVAEEPHVYDPAPAKRDRKDSLPSANVDPAPVKEEPKALVAVTVVHQSIDPHGVESIVRAASDGAIVKCRDIKDVYDVQIAATVAGKDLSVVHRKDQESRMIWRVPGE